ncbi:YjcZ family sporulation protein [Lysinibacillus fusiformis]
MGTNYEKHDNLSFALIVVLFILLIIVGTRR